jgi:hypothetical protein
MPPIPCAHCGTLFMRQTTDTEAPKLCNNCILKAAKTYTHIGTNPMSKVTIMLECDREIHIAIEEICLNKGISFSEYFLNLHALNTQVEWKVKPDLEITDKPQQIKKVKK